MSKSNDGRLGNYFEDAEFAQKQRVIHAHFVKRLADFTAFDANLHAAFAADWLAFIQIFEALPSDETMIDTIAQATDDLDIQRKVCYDSIRDIEYYAHRAFPDNAKKNREFGFNAARKENERDIRKMIVNLMVTRKVAVDYTAELTAVGMPAGMLLAFKDKAGALGDSEVHQEYTKRLRIRAFENRVNGYNSLYRTYIRVRLAAYSIYSNQPETRQLFDM